MGICFGVSLLSNNSAISNGNTNSNSVNSMALSPPSSTISNSIANLNAGAHDNISISSLQSSTVKSIDMATATNVFDFLLNNHVDLFPTSGDYSSQKPPSNLNYSASNQNNNNNTSINNSSINNSNNKSLTSPDSSTPPVVSKITSNGGTADPDTYQQLYHQHTASISSSHHHANPHNRYSVMINDRKFMENYGGAAETTAAVSAVNLNHKSSFNAGTTSVFSNGAAQSNNSPSHLLSSSISTSTLAISNGMPNGQISNLNRHIKKNSLDSRFVDSTNELTASNTSLSSNKTTQSNQLE